MSDCCSSTYIPAKNSIKNKRELLFTKLLHWSFKQNICQTSILQYKVNVKVKQSYYRPGQALRVPGG